MTVVEQAPDLSREPAPHRSGFRMAGHMLGILGAIMLCFVAQLALIGAIKHERDQDRAYTELRALLANGTAPVTALTEDGRLIDTGTPMAILEIPRLRVREVVGEGTSSESLKSGPGHLRNSPMPGQSGMSMIFGRRAGYGGPFGLIDQLRRGDDIIVTTGQGEHRYQVQAVRHAGDPQRFNPQAGRGGLTLATADGPYFLPTDVLWVDAQLTSEVQPTSGAIPAFAVPDNELAMAGDADALVPVVLWSLILIVGAIGVVYVSQRVGRWHAWVIGVPVIGVLSVTLADQATALLPNLL